MSGPSVCQVATNTYLVDGGLVNWVLVTEGDAVLLIDAGLPGHRRAIDESIRMIGHRPGEIVGVLITHANVAHLGAVPQLLGRHPFPVLMDPAEVSVAKGERLDTSGSTSTVRNLFRPGHLRWSLAALRLGASESIRIPTAQALVPGRQLDLPGRPVAVPTRGHTAGHCAYLLPDAGAVATGDALVTRYPASALWGPQLPPPVFSANPTEAAYALDALLPLDADLLLPGHGTSYCGSVPDAVALAWKRAGARLPFGRA